MFIKKLPIVLALFIVGSCGSKIPQKTNVLLMPRSQQNKALPAEDANGSTRAAPVKSEPEYRVKEKDAATVTAPVRSASKDGPTAATDNAISLLFGFPREGKYYKHIADSMQTYAKPSYEETIDQIVDQISKKPVQAKNPAVNTQWYASVNFNIRKPNFVILHHTGQNSVEQTLFTFSINRTQTSAHYVVGRDGTVYQMLNDYVRAWHAGSSKWGNITDVNSCSLGVEIDNNGNEPFSDLQITALIKLLGYLKSQYTIPQSNFIAHLDIAPGRKIDPSRFFPWKRLAAAGFGYWYDADNMKTPPADFNALLALKVIGYDTNNAANAIKSFKLHYVQTDTSAILTDYDKKVLYNIFIRY